jgi:hypothetical protein
METTSRAFTHDNLEIWHSAFVLSVVGIEEIGAMKDGSDGFADIIDVRFGTNPLHFDLHK